MTKTHRSIEFRPSHNVVALIYDGLCTFEFGIAFEVFGLDRPEISGDWYQFKSVALEAGTLRAAGGLEVSATGTQQDLLEADTIIVAGWRGKDENVPPVFCDALRAAHDRGARIVSICSGVFVLAEAGLLKDCAVTTHWRYLDDFARRFPGITLQSDKLYVECGNIITSAGSSAGIDMCLHIVRTDFGDKIANSVARRLVMHAHRQGGQTQFIERPIPLEKEAHRLSSTLDFVRSNIKDGHTISSLAEYSGMGARTFQRKFLSLTGLTVGRWITQERLAHACLLLESTRVPVEAIAETVGMSDVSALRYHFRKKFNVSPGEYRKRFAVREDATGTSMHEYQSAK